MSLAGEIARADDRGLVGHAVHRHRPWTMDGLKERLFTFAFKRMVYAQIWEDPAIDLEAMAIQPDSRIVTIASGGCNVLSYLTAKPAHIFAVDLNETHLALLELKLAAAKWLPDYAGFAMFFGAADSKQNVARYDTILRPHLDARTRAYWEGRDALGRRRITRFARGFYRYGLLGRFIGMAHVLARLQGRDPRRMLEAHGRDEQHQIFDRELAPLFDRPIVKRLLDSPLSLFGLGIPPAQYDELCAGHGRASDVVRERLRRLACDFDLRSNYFAWQAFNRGYSQSGMGPVPPYLEQSNFAVVRDGVDRVHGEQTNFIAFLRRQPDASLDRYVLLDAQDWMDDPVLTDLWSEITRTARAGARVIFRTAAVDSPVPGRVPSHLTDQWTYEAARSKALHGHDRSAIYGGFHLYILKRAANGLAA